MTTKKGIVERRGRDIRRVWGDREICCISIGHSGGC